MQRRRVNTLGTNFRMATDQATSESSPDILYGSLLFDIANMISCDKANFALWCCIHNGVSQDILETNMISDWLRELHSKGKICEDDLTFIERFFEAADLPELQEKVKIYKETRKEMSKMTARIAVAEDKGESN